MSGDEAQESSSEAEEAPTKEQKFKRYCVRKQYDVIDEFYEEGKSVPWRLEWQPVRFIIDEPNFGKSWELADSKFDLKSALSEPDGAVPNDENDEARDQRLRDRILEQVEFKEEAPSRLLTGRGRITNKVRIGILDLEEGEQSGLLAGFDEVEFTIQEHDGRHVGHVMHWTGELLKYEDRDDPYIVVECYVPVGTLDDVREEYLSTQGSRVVVVATRLLLWEWAPQGSFGEPYQLKAYHLLDEEYGGTSSAVVATIGVTTGEKPETKDKEDDEWLRNDDEEPTEEVSEIRETIPHLLAIERSVIGLKWAIWVVGFLIFFAVLLSR